MSSQPEEHVEQHVPMKTQEVSDVPTKGNALEVMEAAALLTVWSLLVIAEGAIRFQDVVNVGTNFPEVEASLDFSEGRPLQGVIFFAALFEVIFGFIGLFVGISAFVYRAYSTPITKICMMVQSLLGWYVFAVYVFTIPAMAAADATASEISGISLGLYRFLVTLGILTSFHWCLALQGGQFLFFARLIAAATGQDFLKQLSGMKMRAMFWSGNLALSGLWSAITGAILVSELSGGRTMPFILPPNVGRLPTLLLIAGLVTLVTGLLLMAMSATNKSPPLAFYGSVGVSYLFTWLNFTIVQFGFLPKFRGGPVAMHHGLVFMLYFLGPYFLHKQTRSQGTVPEPEYAV